MQVPQPNSKQHLIGVHGDELAEALYEWSVGSC